ncbi:MAG: hypothetical protein A2Z01_02985 [Betaproteobacteria bacterium RBG_16_58_11]|nr:MAG: hypothetical protein A2Z01_02985 [Betaproteobacteria bacterium RBG_16_58_11]
MGIHWHSGACAMSVSNYGRAVLLLGIGIVSGIALTIFGINESGWWQGEAKLEPGSHPFEADINEVRSFAYTTNVMMLTAQRSMAGGPLAVQVTYADNRAPQHCISSPELGGVLSSFAHSKVIKQIRPQEIKSKYPIILGHLEVKDAVIGEPITPWKLSINSDHSIVVVEKLSAAFEIDISPTTFKQLEAGCAQLAKR